MKYLIVGILWLFATMVHAEPPKTEAKSTAPVPRVELKTNLGKITLELMPEQAPVSVENFLSYAQSGFYKGAIFHRVLKGFLIQGGGYTTNFEAKPTRPPIINEANNGLKNVRGSVAMARLPDPNSATSQFFINTAENGFLDYSSTQEGYAVFGQVTEGMDIVDKIQAVATKEVDNVGKNVPVELVIVEEVKIENMPVLKTVESKPPVTAPNVEKPVEKVAEKTTEKSAAPAEVKSEKPQVEKNSELNQSVEKTEVKPADNKEIKSEVSPPAPIAESTPPDDPSTPDVPIPMMH
jgi:cyclophilin family peptidyl-prolyl cis-trans isomerase